ncbi:Hypothetical predicted protein [Olea europaea subsp. europaea]|uniref:Uncharacterized protein n=1 Tax=Olea europaea subsp. europaea TaxID=158383 RepID=A0A8S0SRN7_OLEEU|nr:Hypothetical predicted protein [Olea europaea subsp. europaea]
MTIGIVAKAAEVDEDKSILYRLEFTEHLPFSFQNSRWEAAQIQSQISVIQRLWITRINLMRD